MAYDVNHIAKVKHLEALAARVVAAIAPLSDAIKSIEMTGNSLKFYTSTDKSGTPAFTCDIAEANFLDTAKTTFVTNFAFSSATYPGATDPNLNGKPVLVLALKENSTATSVTYSFVNLETLVKIYTAKDSSLEIDGDKISVKISAAEGNSLELKNDGLYSGGATKVTGAVEDNLVAFDANGNLKDSGYTIATDAEVTEMLNAKFGAA